MPGERMETQLPFRFLAWMTEKESNILLKGTCRGADLR